MKKIILILTLLVIGFESLAQTKWEYDKTHAKIGFSISHFGISETEGKFTSFSGGVTTKKTDFSDAKFDISIDVNSINTENEDRDKHLKSADFFDTDKFPTINFKSKSLKSVGKNKYKMNGDITIHGVTKNITLDLIYSGTVEKDPFGNTKAGFKIRGTIDRTQFGLKWNGKLATGNVLVGDQVDLHINIELQKVKS
jgi:polyisoprenoid-binding protein YceI